MGAKLIALNHSTEPIYQRATTLTWAVDNIARTKVALTELLSNLETSHKVGDQRGLGQAIIFCNPSFDPSPLPPPTLVHCLALHRRWSLL